MIIQVIPSVGEVRSEDLYHKTVIVIDVLRATSTMLTALANGCRQIIPVETVNQAKASHSEGTLLGGERFCKKIPGFDLGNSPLEYTTDVVSSKTLIFTTTNGTRAIQKAGKASHILIGALLNAKACASMAASFHEEIVIICSGTQDVFALEDGLCAGAIIDELTRRDQTDASPSAALTLNDFGLSMLYAYRNVQDRLEDALLASSNGKRLGKIGFKNDLIYCAQMNLFDFSPLVRGGKIETAYIHP